VEPNGNSGVTQTSKRTYKLNITENYGNMSFILNLKMECEVQAKG